MAPATNDRVAFCTALAALFSALVTSADLYALDLSVSGTVKDNATSAAIAGATVTLEGYGLSATTDATGAYRISGQILSNLSPAPGSLQGGSTVAVLMGGPGGITMRVPLGATVRLELYDCNGKMAAGFLRKNADGGLLHYRPAVSRGMYLGRATVNGDKPVAFVYRCLERPQIFAEGRGSRSAPDAHGSEPLQKTAVSAAPDSATLPDPPASLTLTAAKSGYLTGKQTVAFTNPATVDFLLKKGPSVKFSVLAFFKGTLWPEYGRPPGKVMCKELAAAKGFTVDITEDASAFTDANLDKYQVVVFWCTSGADILNEAQLAAFKRYIEKGRGFVPMHCAISWGSKGNIAGGSLNPSPWYQELTGSTFGGCPIGFNIQPGNVIIEDSTHMTTSFLKRRVWKVLHEWYAYTPNPRSLPGMKVLMTLDQSALPKKLYDEWPLVWCREVKGARSFYMTFGDAPEQNKSDPEFREFFYRALLWAAGHDTMP